MKKEVRKMNETSQYKNQRKQIRSIYFTLLTFGRYVEAEKFFELRSRQLTNEDAEAMKRDGDVLVVEQLQKRLHSDYLDALVF